MIKIILYIKKILKKESNSSIENIKICVLLLSIDERLLVGKKPPEEIIVKAKFNELNDLILEKFKIKKIKTVKPEYKKNILIVCLKVSDLLKEMKLVNDFFKLSSYISIKYIIENKK